jgi:hypothetical protein
VTAFSSLLAPGGDDPLTGLARLSLADRLAALRSAAVPIAQTALAAAIAWLFARHVVGHPRPFFAPIAACISLGLTLGQRGRRTVDMVIGVALGVLVADALTAAIGTGPVAIGAVVVVAMSAAVLLRGGPLLITHAASSAVIVATLPRTGGGVLFARPLDALVGGAAALAVSFALPTDPVRRTRDAARPVLDELAAVLDDVADALRARRLDSAEAALSRARGIEARARLFRDTLATARDTIRLAPPRSGARSRLALYATAATQLDLAERNVRVLARGAVRALQLDDRVPPELPDALEDLARAVRALERALEGDQGAREAREAAVRAAGRATLVLERTGNLSVSVLVGQVRATAVDLLRSLGVARAEAEVAVRRAAAELEAEELA